MIKDERIQSSIQHIASQGFMIVYFLILASLLYRQFYLKQTIEQYWDIAAIFFIGALYVSISIFYRGAIQRQDIAKMYKVMIPIIIIGIVAVVFFQGQITSVKQLITTIISSVIGLSLILVLFYLLYRRWESKI